MDIALQKLLARSQKTKGLHPNDIPDLDLYMDQVIALMQTYLGGGDKEPLTRTMIHNYSKAGLISPMKGKKYTKQQILQMLVIYSLKNTLSIAQIKRVLTGIAGEDVPEDALEQCFSQQLAQRDSLNEQISDSIDRILQVLEVSTDDPAKTLTLLLTLTDIADTFSAFAAAIAQECFADPQK